MKAIRDPKDSRYTTRRHIYDAESLVETGPAQGIETSLRPGPPTKKPSVRLRYQNPSDAAENGVAPGKTPPLTLGAIGTVSDNFIDLDLALKSTMTPAQAGVIVVDRQFRITRCTPRAMRAFGVKPTDIGQSIFSRAKRLGIQDLRKKLAQVVGSQDAITTYFGSGEMRYLAQISPHFGEMGQCTGAALTFTDLSRFHQINSERSLQQRRFHSLFDRAPFSLQILDFSSAKKQLNDLRDEGISDFKNYYRENPDAGSELMRSCRLVAINESTLSIFGIASKEEYAQRFHELFELNSYKEWLVPSLADFAEGRSSSQHEFELNTFSGKRNVISFKEFLDESNTMLWSLVDITDLRKTEKALRESEHRFDLLLQSTGNGLIIVDVEGSIIKANKQAEAIFGYSASELSSLKVESLVDSEKRANHSDLRYYAYGRLDSSPMTNREVNAVRKDGTTFPVEVDLAPVTIDGERFVIATVQDVSARVEAREELRELAEKYRAVIETSPDGFLMTDRKLAVIETNEVFQRMFELGSRKIEGLSLAEFIPEAEAQIWKRNLSNVATLKDNRFEVTHTTAKGEKKSLEVTVSASDIEGGRVYAFVRDITARKAAEQEIRTLAYYDFLTGLPNRRLLIDRIRLAAATSELTGGHCALLFFDIDNFKRLNDTMGHKAGDQLLAEVGKRLTSLVDESDTVARLGGDEFIVMLENLDASSTVASTQAEMTSMRLIRGLSKPYTVRTGECSCTTSIGISLFRGHTTTVDDLFKRTDVAMYKAKSHGPSQVCFYDAELQASIAHSASLEAELRVALAQNQISLYYQPQVDQNRRAIGAEGLARWQRPDGSMVMPNEFIPVAEQAGLIWSLGEQVLREACLTLAKWATDPRMSSLVVSVNVSASQLRARNFVSLVEKTLKETGAPPHRLQLELTESVLVDNIDLVRSKFDSLKAKGVKISLDDFGTGYSSLSYLKSLPIDQLKIDRSFTSDMMSNESSQSIAKAIIALGNNLNLDVIAEGVESLEQWDFLTSSNCHAGQGYLFGRPAPIDTFEQALASNQHSL